MPRLIEIQNVRDLPRNLALAVGDALWLVASGARIEQAQEAVQLLGPFVQGVLGPAGELVTPAGPPNALFLLARAPGNAVITVMTGGPWGPSGATTVQVTVEP